jgi:malate dehydrogenase (oxaloacetate-decarboxylating)
MERKAMLFKEFGGIDAYPICLRTKNPDEHG